MVEVFLNVHGTQVLFLSIPDSDVQRLSKRPFKWIRYVLFAICGARGDISMTPDGPPVNYNSSSLANAAYHYNPTGMLLLILSQHAHNFTFIQKTFIFVDYEALNDRITSTAETNTPRLGSFRQNVMNRDGELCIITRESEQFCEAAHLIPKCKGDEVFFLVSGYVMFFEQLRFLVHSEDY
jgi:hypothetical protein